ncbi:MAG: Gfo/Idh/MocA family oxidoreductase [Acidimicrobiales bacterium]
MPAASPAPTPTSSPASRTSVVGVADTDAARAAALAERFGCIAFPSHGAMAANTDLDGVIVCTSATRPPSPGLPGRRRGRALRKPLTINTATAGSCSRPPRPVRRC